MDEDTPESGREWSRRSCLGSWLVGALTIRWDVWRFGYATALAASVGTCVIDLSGVGTGGLWRYHAASLSHGV